MNYLASLRRNFGPIAANMAVTVKYFVIAGF